MILLPPQMVDTRYGLFIYIHRTYILQLIAHQLISACTTGVGRAYNSWYASAQQLLCGWRYRLLRLIILILPATSKGYSEDFLRKTEATMIALTSNSDSTYKVQRRYWEVVMIVLTMRKAACSAYSLTMAQHCPLPIIFARGKIKRWKSLYLQTFVNFAEN